MAVPATYEYRSQVQDESQRRIEGMRGRRTYATKIPLVVGKVNKSALPELARSKFLFPATAKVSDLCLFINKKMFRSETAPLFMFVDDEVVVPSNSTLAELYQEHRNDDYFLYLSYHEENIYSAGVSE